MLSADRYPVHSQQSLICRAVLAKFHEHIKCIKDVDALTAYSNTEAARMAGLHGSKFPLMSLSAVNLILKYVAKLYEPGPEPHVDVAMGSADMTVDNAHGSLGSQGAEYPVQPQQGEQGQGGQSHDAGHIPLGQFQSALVAPSQVEAQVFLEDTDHQVQEQAAATINESFPSDVGPDCTHQERDEPIQPPLKRRRSTLDYARIAAGPDLA